MEGLEKALEHGFKDDKDIKETLANYYIKNGTPELATEMTSDDLTKIRSYLDNGKDEKAFELIQNIEKDYKKNPKFLALVAQYYFQKSQFDEALAIVDEYEKFAKNSPLIYQMRAMIFDGQKKTFEASINWAKYNILLGNKDVALNEYMQAYAMNNEDVELVYTIAIKQLLMLKNAIKTGFTTQTLGNNTQQKIHYQTPVLKIL